jgi:WD40 repeat protein
MNSLFLRSARIALSFNLVLPLATITGLSAVSQDHAGEAAVADVTSTAPVAYVYVSYNSGAPPNSIAAYAASANGKLTPVSGSPFADDVANMAVNVKYLFGSTTNGVSVAAYAIQSNGALHLSHTTEVDKNVAGQCDYANPLRLDHTGANLYRVATVGGLCDSSDFESYQILESNGQLHYLGDSGQFFLFSDPITLISTNKFAYGSDCVDYEGGYLDTFHGFRRASTGQLVLDNSIHAPVPTPANSGDFYCRSAVASDGTGHLAIALQAINTSSEETDGAQQLATYATDVNGNLSTTSTHSNMPAVAVGYVNDLRMSPSGKLLAVAGQGGLQVFHYSGGSPITHDTGLLTTENITEMYWDNANHLYAIASGSGGYIHVYTVTPTSASEAPGSPYPIANPANIIVLPK